MMSWYCLYILCSSYTCIYEKRRVVMIEYAIKKILNKERKEKGNHYSSLDFIELT